MGVLGQNSAFRKSSLGVLVSKAYTPLVVETKTLFTVSGLCIITSIFGEVTTAITVANTVKLQANPTTGTTSDLVAATDLGTTDTAAGNLVSFDGVKASSIATGPGSTPTLSRQIPIAAGTIEQVTATGADGGITWYLTYVPIAEGATIVAA